VTDIEDLVLAGASLNGELDDSDTRDMINPVVWDSLTEQGYKLIGSHSGVNMCRQDSSNGCRDMAMCSKVD